MNILLVVGPEISLKEPYSSGIESFIVSLANNLVENDHSVHVVAKDAESDVSFQVIQYGLLDIREYDIVHYNLFIPELYKVANEFNKPAVLTLHSPVDEQRASTYRSFAKHTNVTFVAVSNRMQAHWRVALDTRMPVIHNGIDLKQWPLKRPTQNGYLLWSGRINSKKNVTAAIELAKHLKQPLKIAGRITDQIYFDECVKPFLSEDITYVGHTTQKELSKLAAGASVFLATARWQEPFGLSTLEMLASGVPAIGFDTALPPDLRCDGVSLAAPSTDWHDLIELVGQVATTDPQDCRNFANAFSVEEMTQAYSQLYQTLLQ